MRTSWAIRAPNVDAEAQIIVAHELTQCGSDQGQLVPLVEAIENNLGRKPEQASADSGYCSEPNLKALVAGLPAAVQKSPYHPAVIPGTSMWRCSYSIGADMPKGTVKWFNSQKGYGFIQPQGGSKDVFVHISAVERAGLSSLNEGQVVEYEEVSNRGKTSAENLRVQR